MAVGIPGSPAARGDGPSRRILALSDCHKSRRSGREGAYAPSGHSGDTASISDALAKPQSSNVCTSCIYQRFYDERYFCLFVTETLLLS
jgi:hypothetical protein